MYRRYLQQTKPVEANEEQAANNTTVRSEAKDSQPTKPKPKKKKKPKADPVTPYQSKSGTLVPPTLTPSTAAVLGDYTTESVRSSGTFRLYIGGLSKEDEAEHRALSEVLPRVRTYCQRRKYEFQVVNFKTLDLHCEVTSDVCQHELKTCQNVSAGVNYLLFLTGTERFTLLPKHIVSEQFERLCSAKCISHEEKALIMKWYKCDENFWTPTHVLLPLRDGNLQTTINTEALSERENIYSITQKAAKEVLSVQEAKELNSAGLDMEIKTGIVNAENAHEKCLCLRKIETDAKTKEEKTTLKSRESLIKDKIGTIHHYSVKDKHSVAQLKQILEQQLCQLIEETIAHISQRFPNLDDELHVECLHHMQICREKLKGYIDRPELLKTLKDHILGDTTYPLILYGPRGGGKSTVMAAAAREAFDWIGKEGGVILRFLGCSPASSDETWLLASIHGQLYRIMDVPLDQPRKDTLTSRESFSETLKNVKKGLQGRLVIFLDGTECLYSDGDARHILTWFPEKLHPNVKIILSTSVEETSIPISRIKESVDEQSMLFVPGLDTTVSVCAIHDWLKGSNRKLTDQQYEKLKNSLSVKESIPLVLKTLAAQATLWTSFEDVNEFNFTNSLVDLFNSSVDRLEKECGTKFVSYSLAYITAAKNGLTESELIDLLSFDTEGNETVSESYLNLQRHQIGLLSLTRFTSKAQYLIERTLQQGKYMVGWCHPLYKDLTKDRYLSSPTVSKEIHRTLASYFSKTWYIKRDAIKKYKGEPEDVINERKLDALSYHYTRAGMLNELKSECLFNADYFYYRLHWTDASSLMEDFNDARLHFPEDEDIRVLKNYMTQAVEALDHPDQLASQLLDRLSKEKFAGNMLDYIRTWKYPRLEATPCILGKTGDQLIHSMFIGEETDSLSVCRVKGIGDLALLGSETTDSISVVNITEGRVMKKIFISKKHEESNTPTLAFAHDGSLLLVSADRTTYAFDIQGQLKYKISHGESYQIGFCGKDYDKIVAVSQESTTVYSSLDGSELFSVQGLKRYWLNSYLGYKIGHHSENFMVVLDNSSFVLFSLEDRSCSQPVEFESYIGGIAISKDETIIALGIFLEYEGKGEKILIYDVKTLERIKEFKVEVTFNRTLSISHDSKFVFYAGYSNQVVMLNLETGHTGILYQDSDIITDARRLDPDTWVSTSENRITVWREDKSAYSTQFEWNKENTLPISKIFPMNNPRYVLLIREDNDDGDYENGPFMAEKEKEESKEGTDEFVIQVYDISSKKVVRQTTQIRPTPSTLGKEIVDDDDLVTLRGCVLIDDSSLVILVRSGKMVKISLDTMKVTLVYETSREEICCVAHNRRRDEMDPTAVLLSKASGDKEVVTRATSKGTILVYDNISGKRVAKLRPPSDVKGYRIEYIKVNESGEICITLAECRSKVLVFNIPKRQYLFEVHLDDTDYDLTFMPMSGKFMAVLLKKYGRKTQYQREINATKVLSLRENPGEVAKLYVDTDYKMYIKKIPKWSPLPRTMEINVHLFVDNDYYVTSSEDGLMRIWDMNTDELERIRVGKLEDPDGGATVGVLYAGQGPIIVTYSGKTFKVWRKGSWELLGTFTLDTAIFVWDWTILKDGRSFIVATSHDEIHHVTLKNAGIDTDLSKETELFPGEDCDNHLNMEAVEWTDDGPHESDSDSEDYYSDCVSSDDD